MGTLAKAFQESLHPRDPHSGEWIHVGGNFRLFSSPSGELHEFGNLSDQPKFVKSVTDAVETIRSRYQVGPSFMGVAALSSRRENLLGFRGKKVARHSIMATGFVRGKQLIYVNDRDQSHRLQNLTEMDRAAIVGRLAPSDRDAQGRTMHEMGHVLADQHHLTEDQILQGLLDSGLVKLTDYGKDQGTGFTPTADDFDYEGEGQLYMDKANLEGISQYALYSLTEAFGELFGMANHPDPWGYRDISDETKAEYQKMFEKFAQSINSQAGGKVI